MHKTILAVLLITFTIFGAVAADNGNVELGTILWLRDYDSALSLAAQTGKPILILFQEVPGCSTCRNYGLHVLSHPLLSEAAEQLFVPLAIFNNRSGKDAEVLQLFDEPSWNNPVVRIVDPKGRELTRRLAGDYSPGGFSGAMIAALDKIGTAIPSYLRTTHAELSAQGTAETAMLSMFCFWQGEIELGSIPGVIATRAGYIGGSEVVELRYDPDLLSYEKLLRRAARLRCADTVFPLNTEQRTIAERVLGPSRVRSLARYRADENTKYYLSKSLYRFLPLTQTQKVLANIAVYHGDDPLKILSPRQQEALIFIRNHPEKSWQDLISSDDFRSDWKKVWEQTQG